MGEILLGPILRKISFDPRPPSSSRRQSHGTILSLSLSPLRPRDEIVAEVNGNSWLKGLLLSARQQVAFINRKVLFARILHSIMYITNWFE